VDFWIAGAAILGVLSAGVLAGVLIGIVLSIVWLVYISATPNMHVLGRKPGTNVFQGIDDHPDGITYPGLLVLRFDAGLFFASTDALVDRLIDLYHQADPRLHTIVLDFEGVNFIDSQGAATLDGLIELARSRDIELRISRLKTDVKEVLQRDGFIDRLGENKIYGEIYDAIEDVIPMEVK
jgi:anti-anti-sigma factor